MRLIDADNLLIALSNAFCTGNIGYPQAENVVNDQPTIDPEPLRPTAHWINRGYVCGEHEYECSACHETEWRTSASRMKYCMFCGKRMVNAND